MQLIKPDTKIDFMGKRKLFMAISGALLIVSLAFIFIRGINYGIDFAGGILVQVKFEKATTTEDIRKAIAPVGLGEVVVQSFGAEDGNEYLIRSQTPDISLEKVGNRVEAELSKIYTDNKLDIRRVETVGAKAGKDLREKAMMAIFFAILLMTVYLSGRFEAKWGLSAVMALVLGGATMLAYLLLTALEISHIIGMVILIIVAVVMTCATCWLLRLRYASGTVVSIIHDVVIVVGIYCLTGKEFNLATVAAVLTIIGFSINDTIIIYDRIRENLKKGLRVTFFEVINRSVNQTLSRTIITSGTTLMVLVFLFFWGGKALEDFAFALIIGVVVGTYSSIYIASATLLFIPESKKKKITDTPPREIQKKKLIATQAGSVENEEESTVEKAVNNAKAVKTIKRSGGSKNRKKTTRR